MRRSYKIGAGVLDVEIMLSKRKTAAIEVRQNKVRLKAPLRTPLVWIDEFIYSKADWIARQWREQRVRYESHAISLSKKPEVFYLGQRVPVVITVGASQTISHLSEDGFMIDVSQRTRRDPTQVADEQLRIWFTHQARAYLADRLGHLSETTGMKPNGIIIGNYKSLWGRCSARGEIALNWRLLLAQPEAIDYVIIHELCHLREFNHSSRFWKLVTTYCPEVEVYRSYFKERSVWLNWR